MSSSHMAGGLGLRWFMSLGLHMKDRIQGFPSEYYSSGMVMVLILTLNVADCVLVQM